MEASIWLRQKLSRLVKWISINRNRIFLILFLYPNIVCYTPDSTSTPGTVVDALFGWGKFANVSYGCKGQVLNVDKYSFTDYGFSITRNFNPFQFGFRIGGFFVDYQGGTKNYYSGYSNSYDSQDNPSVGSTYYTNPFVGIENQYVAVNLGVVLFSDWDDNYIIEDYIFKGSKFQPSFYLRIGNRKKLHYTLQYLSSIPLLSSGIMSLGLGFGSEESRNLTWVGFAAGPYQNFGITLKQALQLNDGLDLLLQGRIGQIEGNFEGGISLGARYNF